MMQKVYIDTSVIGGCFDDEFEEWSNKLFTEFTREQKLAIISDVTLDELSLARKEVQDKLKGLPEKHKEYVLLDEEAEKLANEYLKESVITPKYFEDALHIAIATVNKIDVLVSWNFRHIVNLNRIRQFHAVNLKCGYQVLEIRTPREILKSNRYE